MIIEQTAAEQRTSCWLNEPDCAVCFVFIDSYGRGGGVGRGLGVSAGLGVGEGLAVDVAVGLGDRLAVGVAVAVALGVGVAVGVGAEPNWTSNEPTSMRSFRTRENPGPRWS